MSIFNKVTKSFQWGDKTVVMETGEIARQASGAVLVNIDDTVVLATVVGSKSAKAGQDFFPLTVDYIEKTYAAGKIPGSFFKREAKPSELETLTSRLIDRPIRPLFPEGFYNEVHVVIHTISLNPEVDADIAALIAVSAALSISGIPFNGPIGAARVGYVNGEYVLNPGQTARKVLAVLDAYAGRGRLDGFLCFCLSGGGRRSAKACKQRGQSRELHEMLETRCEALQDLLRDRMHEGSSVMYRESHLGPGA